MGDALHSNLRQTGNTLRDTLRRLLSVVDHYKPHMRLILTICLRFMSLSDEHWIRDNDPGGGSRSVKVNEDRVSSVSIEI